MSHLAQTNVDHDIKLLEPHREVRHAGFTLITSDEGLCGGLNASILKRFLAQAQEYQERGIEVEIVCLDSKGLAAYQSIGLNVIASTTSLDSTPRMEALLGPLTEVFRRYEKHKLDRIHMAYLRFINAMRQGPCMEALLFIDENFIDDGTGHSSPTWEHLYESSPIAVLEYLVRRYLEFMVHQTLSDSMASKQATHTVAVRAVTDNAGNAIKELCLVYNRSHQAAVTTELSEVVADIAAV